MVRPTHEDGTSDYISRLLLWDASRNTYRGIFSRFRAEFLSLQVLFAICKLRLVCTLQTLFAVYKLRRVCTLQTLKNYRPISNLPFLSKILEKVVLHKLLSHLQENNLSNPFQSAYRAGHSTETVLLRIVNDILSALDNDNISVLLLLDLSAAFDTIDHQILLSLLNSVFGIQSTALQWFHSYLSDRYQSISVNNSTSSLSQLMYGVPQGSVLGPILFVLTRLLLALRTSPSLILPGTLESFLTQTCPWRSTS